MTKEQIISAREKFLQLLLDDELPQGFIWSPATWHKIDGETCKGCAIGMGFWVGLFDFFEITPRVVGIYTGPAAAALGVPEWELENLFINNINCAAEQRSERKRLAEKLKNVYEKFPLDA